MQKVANLTGGLLDYWVALALEIEGAKLKVMRTIYNGVPSQGEPWCEIDCAPWTANELRLKGTAANSALGHHVFCPSTDWVQGGLLVDKRCIDIDQDGARSPDVKCRAVMTSFSKDVPQRRMSSFGPTALIAAMRAIVVAKFGEEVDGVVV